jgi:hypothetical protein
MQYPQWQGHAFAYGWGKSMVIGALQIADEP